MRWGLIAVATLSAVVLAVSGYWLLATSLVLLVAYVAVDMAHERRRNARRHNP
jgi:uncharacterized membrane protein SpoIIM required for sporulation